MEGLEKYAELAKDIKPTPEMIAFAQVIFPKISAETVDKNYIEIAYAMQFAHNCAKCFGLQHCPNKTKGLEPMATGIRPDGWMEWAFVNCKYNADWRYVRK